MHGEQIATHELATVPYIHDIPAEAVPRPAVNHQEDMRGHSEDLGRLTTLAELESTLEARYLPPGHPQHNSPMNKAIEAQLDGMPPSGGSPGIPGVRDQLTALGNRVMDRMTNGDTEQLVRTSRQNLDVSGRGTQRGIDGHARADGAARNQRAVSLEAWTFNSELGNRDRDTRDENARRATARRMGATNVPADLPNVEGRHLTFSEVQAARADRLEHRHRDTADRAGHFAERDIRSNDTLRSLLEGRINARDAMVADFEARAHNAHAVVNNLEFPADPTTMPTTAELNHVHDRLDDLDGRINALGQHDSLRNQLIESRNILFVRFVELEARAGVAGDVFDQNGGVLVETPAGDRQTIYGDGSHQVERFNVVSGRVEPGPREYPGGEAWVPPSETPEGPVPTIAGLGDLVNNYALYRELPNDEIALAIRQQGPGLVTRIEEGIPPLMQAEATQRAEVSRLRGEQRRVNNELAGTTDPAERTRLTTELGTLGTQLTTANTAVATTVTNLARRRVAVHRAARIVGSVEASQTPDIAAQRGRTAGRGALRAIGLGNRGTWEPQPRFLADGSVVAIADFAGQRQPNGPLHGMWRLRQDGSAQLQYAGGGGNVDLHSNGTF